ncbi:MAG: SUMF1/EgtB/PvdO family nonheme iron enzyme [Gammaproteobacteria bacterium]|nr:SUMF1/EgtB/PvdO family nonheme iron enzyme [Gammaproteobacteria bacterium]
MSRTLATWLLTLAAFAAANGIEANGIEIEWPGKFYNPQPLAGDLVLPMPCGGAMVFRPVATQTQLRLDDQRVELGTVSAELGYSEHPRAAHIAGSFSAQGALMPNIYWLGKYEVTEMQWNAVTHSSACLSVNMHGRLPISRINWFDAVQFAHRYTAWLYAHSLDAIPREEGQAGFIRLPTEVEWEYAARGGNAVSGEAFKQRTFPMAGGMQRYVWFDHPARGQRQPAGLLKPNPLGLFDILGNVEEIVLEPYRLHKVIRLHGQAGGFITKGGHFFTTGSAIRSAYRREYAPFNQQQGNPTRVATIGARMAIGNITITSRAILARIKAQWHLQPRSSSR